MHQKRLLFCALLVVSFQVLISFPLTMWAENQFNFTMGLPDATGMAVLVSVLITGTVVLLCLLIPPIVSAYILPFLAVLSVLIYLQQNILIWDYGILDGAQVNFASNSRLGYIDLALWLAGLAAYLLLRKAIAAKSGLILSFTAGVTIIATATAFLAFETSDSNANVRLTDDKKFSFSSEKNMLLFLLDGFQSDLFWEIIDTYPNLRNEFAGFTFYPNTSAVFAKTYPSVPLLLTGKAYKKAQPISEFINTAYAGSLLAQMIAAGWDVGLYPLVPATIVNSEKYASNIAQGSLWENKVSAYLQALDLSLFRTVPHAAKKYVYNHGEFIAHPLLYEPLESMRSINASEKTAELATPHRHEGLNFLANLQQTMSADVVDPTFRFYHLKMPHQPFVLNRKLEYGLIGGDLDAYREYAYATVKLMVAYLAELRKHGVYDHSTIVIATDHGGGEHTNKKYASDSRSYREDKIDGREKASARALLLVKESGASGTLKLSSKPVSLLDIAPTIAAFAGLDTDGYAGVPLADISDTEAREREYNYYKFTGWDSKYLDDFTVFTIIGNVYDDNAWHKSGVLQASTEMITSKPYKLGDVVRYGSDVKANADHSNAFIVGQEFSYKGSTVQFNTRSFELAVNLAQPLADNTLYALQLSLQTRTHAMRVEVRVGGELLDSLMLPPGGARQHMFFFEPSILERHEKVPVAVDIVDTSDPKGKVALASLQLVEARVGELNDDSVVRFKNTLSRYYPFGFWPKEFWGRWSALGKSYLYFTAGENFCGKGFLLLRLQQFYKDVKPDDFSIAINNHELSAAHFSHDDKEMLYYFDCSKKDFLHAGVNRLVFQPGTRTTKVSSVDSKDRKTQGAAFVSLEFVKHDDRVK